ncbi:MAG: glycerol-3-phosphate acyltransferase [Planctomycetota bacterium]
MPGLLGLVGAAFLLGAIPFAWLLVRVVRKTDVRRHGSGNPGATNASRLFSPRLRLPVFLLVFLLDAGKGYLAVGLLPKLFSTGSDLAPVLCAAAAVAGHIFMPFLGFRGGQGVATTVGVLFALDPVATLFSLGAFFIAAALARDVAAGSLAFAAALPAAGVVRGEEPLSVGVLAVALGVLIVVRHRTNIREMLQRAPP